MRRFALALCGALVAGTAGAQLGGLASNYVEKPTDRMVMASKTGAVLVYGPSGEEVGDVEDVILGFDGSIVAVLVGVGGTLGLAEKPVAVRMEHVTWSRNEEGMPRVTLDMNRAALMDAPKFTPPKE